MSTVLRILSVGTLSPDTRAVLGRLQRKGFGAYDADNLAEATTALGTIHFDVVLAPENLPDGRGYDLTDQVLRQSGSLLVSVDLSETCLWLPVILRGAKVLGERALNVAILEWDMEEILSQSTGSSLNARRHIRGSKLSERTIPKRPSAREERDCETRRLNVRLAESQGPKSSSAPKSSSDPGMSAQGRDR